MTKAFYSIEKDFHSKGYMTLLGPYPFAVYSYLLYLGNNNPKGAYPSYQTIADHCKMSKRMVASSMKELISLGLVKVTKKQHRHSSHYECPEITSVAPNDAPHASQTNTNDASGASKDVTNDALSAPKETANDAPHASKGIINDAPHASSANDAPHASFGSRGNIIPFRTMHHMHPKDALCASHQESLYQEDLVIKINNTNSEYQGEDLVIKRDSTNSEYQGEDLVIKINNTNSEYQRYSAIPGREDNVTEEHDNADSTSGAKNDVFFPSTVAKDQNPATAAVREVTSRTTEKLEHGTADGDPLREGKGGRSIGFATPEKYRQDAHIWGKVRAKPLLSLATENPEIITPPEGDASKLANLPYAPENPEITPPAPPQIVLQSNTGKRSVQQPEGWWDNGSVHWTAEELSTDGPTACFQIYCAATRQDTSDYGDTSRAKIIGQIRGVVPSIIPPMHWGDLCDEVQRTWDQGAEKSGGRARTPSVQNMVDYWPRVARRLKEQALERERLRVQRSRSLPDLARDCSTPHRYDPVLWEGKLTENELKALIQQKPPANPAWEVYPEDMEPWVERMKWSESAMPCWWKPSDPAFRLFPGTVLQPIDRDGKDVSEGRWGKVLHDASISR